MLKRNQFDNKKKDCRCSIEWDRRVQKERLIKAAVKTMAKTL